MNNIDKHIELRILKGKSSEINELQRVLEAAPDYFERITGLPPGNAEAQSMFSLLPEGKSYDDKFVFGIYYNGIMVGFADVLRAYPDAKTSMIGLLLLSEKYQKMGLGSISYKNVEEYVREWKGCKKIRIGILLTNNVVIPFWEKMGYLDTGKRIPYEYGNVKSEVLLFEKVII
ncbi:GNAT family N-acetyltransferase [bacterium]|nr:GNAT family N-acetyltransferase [bacterium]